MVAVNCSARSRSELRRLVFQRSTVKDIHVISADDVIRCSAFPDAGRLGLAPETLGEGQAPGVTSRSHSSPSIWAEWSPNRCSRGICDRASVCSHPSTLMRFSSTSCRRPCATRERRNLPSDQWHRRGTLCASGPRLDCARRGAFHGRAIRSVPGGGPSRRSCVSIRRAAGQLEHGNRDRFSQWPAVVSDLLSR